MTKQEKEKQEVLNNLLKETSKNLCLEFATGTGKSRCSLEYLVSKGCKNIFVFVNVTAQIKNWEDEIKRWGLNDKATFKIVCYRSAEKYAGSTFDGIICDECHHITAKVLKVLITMKSEYKLFLSATIKPSLMNNLKYNFSVKVITIDLHEAIENEILPDPKILLIPLKLDNKNLTETHVLNPKAPNEWKGTVYMRDYWKCKYNKSYKFNITCTQEQKNNAIQGEIYSLKKIIDDNAEAGIRTPVGLLNTHKLKCLQLLKWLSAAREKYTLEILDVLKHNRTITFCSSIEQTERLGKNAIHSKQGKKKVAALLEAFNTKNIKHITAVQMLNEGMNLADCKYGVFGFYNSGKGIQIQKVGRVLRHKEPILVLPYFAGTREEMIVEDMIEGYNPENITKISINELKN